MCTAVNTAELHNSNSSWGMFIKHCNTMQPHVCTMGVSSVALLVELLDGIHPVQCTN